MRASILLAVVLAFAFPACAEKIDLTKALEVQEVSSGWWDSGMSKGQNKLVPSVSFKLKNVSGTQLGTLQVNALFRRATKDNDEWGSGFVRVTGSEGLAPGATSRPVTVNSQLGYTGTEPRQEMLANSHFVDAKVEIFAKYDATQWTKIAEVPITRRLITR
jgi:hypothetical protein